MAFLIFTENFYRMKLKIIWVGKTEENYLNVGSEIYIKRITNYIPTEIITIPALKNAKNLSYSQQKEKEGEQILKYLQAGDFVVLLDEKGKHFTSVEFAEFMNQRMISGIKNLVLIIGGPYGFSESVYQKATQKVALSKMTFSHQMVRLILLEQIYRAFSILNNEPYHHE